MTKEETICASGESTTKSLEKSNGNDIEELRDLISTLSMKKNDSLDDEEKERNVLDSLDYSQNKKTNESTESSPELPEIFISSCSSTEDSSDSECSDNAFDKNTFSLDAEEPEDQEEASKINLENVSDDDKEKEIAAKSIKVSDSEDEGNAKPSDDFDASGEFKFKDDVPLHSKISLLNIHDDSEDEEKEEFVTRGPLTDNKNHSCRYRFSPLHPYPMTTGENTHGFSHHRSSVSPSYENNNAASLYESNYHQFSANETLNQGFGVAQPFNSCVNNDLYASSSQLSPESVHSNSSPFYTSNFSLSANPNAYNYQNELQSEDWFQTVTQASNVPTNIDLGNAGLESYQPLSPPQSVSPPKDGHDGNSNYGGSRFCETEDLKEEDLINVINSVNRTSKSEPKGIPETQTELSILQNVLEGNEYSTRDEMGMYLKNEDACFQPSFIKEVGVSSLLDSASQFSFSYEPPLTPPKSVSPVSPFQDGSPSHDGGYSSTIGLRNNEDCQQLVYSEDNLSFILDGIDEISRDEMNIYMGQENNGSASDPSYARNLIQARCKPNNLDHALRKLSSLSLKTLCDKDADGDTGLMIVYSSDEDSQDFYENIFCLQERVREIRVCCDAPLGKGKRCKICGNADPSKFYTPLSFKNNVGDTALSCAVKKVHSQLIVDYLLHGILQCKEDFRRVFDERGREMLMSICYNYPSLWKYVMYQPGPL